MISMSTSRGPGVCERNATWRGACHGELPSSAWAWTQDTAKPCSLLDLEQEEELLFMGRQSGWWRGTPGPELYVFLRDIPQF